MSPALAALETRMPDTRPADTRRAAPADTLRMAQARHAAGDLSGAEQGYRALMAAGMRECDALYYLGIEHFKALIGFREKVREQFIHGGNPAG